MSRFGCFALGFLAGAITIAGARRLREIEIGEDVEAVSDTIQEQLEKLEARLENSTAGRTKRTKKTASG
ncbi:MAG TPA: hypothetical protein PLX06_01990 [Fimbriimonadaceae bacterium]|nr:hypothetical protein [Fimbriimonadaceae bacterium]